MTIKLADNTTFQFTSSFEDEEFYNNANRRVLTIECASGAIGLDALNGLLTEENTATITLTNDEEEITNIFEGYVLKLSMGVKQRVTSQTDGPTIVEDYIEIKLAKRTYIEQMLHNLGL
jgi:hypothetical protein